jgi:hypothetical protein
MDPIRYTCVQDVTIVWVSGEDVAGNRRFSLAFLPFDRLHKVACVLVVDVGGEHGIEGTRLCSIQVKTRRV